MKKLAVILIALASPALADPPANFDARVEALRQRIGIPGIAIAIVENGRTTLAKGYGVRKLGAPEQVDADTIFPTGSTGKAITTAALATLVDAGKIGWDDKVIDHLPWFQMYDPWVTREITIRDLLVHRSGLGPGQGDLLFVPRSNLSRSESVRRLRYIKPATSFRSQFAYSNLMYMVAGELIEAVSGQTWEDYVRDHVFRPAGMTSSASDDVVRFANPDRAYPHARMDGGLRGAGRQEVLDERDDLGRNAAPGGGLASSANDLAKWLTIQLAHGVVPGGRPLFSEAASREMLTPVMVQPLPTGPDYLAVTRPKTSAYALGWDIEEYRGAKLIWHGGAVLGFKTAVVLLPEKNVGFSIEINSEDGELIRGLIFELLDHYLGLPKADWPERLITYRNQQIADGLKELKTTAAKPAGVAPTVSLASLAGTYRDPWYGDIVISQSGSGLAIDFKSTPRMSGPLRHWQYNSFVTDLTDKTIEPTYVNFGIDSNGRVDRVTMKPVSPIADFSWDYQDLSFSPVKIGQ